MLFEARCSCSASKLRDLAIRIQDVIAIACAFSDSSASCCRNPRPPLTSPRSRTSARCPSLIRTRRRSTNIRLIVFSIARPLAPAQRMHRPVIRSNLDTARIELPSRGGVTAQRSSMVCGVESGTAAWAKSAAAPVAQLKLRAVRPALNDVQSVAFDRAGATQAAS